MLEPFSYHRLCFIFFSSLFCTDEITSFKDLKSPMVDIKTIPHFDINQWNAQQIGEKGKIICSSSSTWCTSLMYWSQNIWKQRFKYAPIQLHSGVKQSKLEKKLLSDEYIIMQKRNKDTSEKKKSLIINLLWSQKILDTTAYLKLGKWNYEQYIET